MSKIISFMPKNTQFIVSLNADFVVTARSHELSAQINFIVARKTFLICETGKSTRDIQLTFFYCFYEF